ncbi:ATP-grasp domain-containing protein [Spirillospora sp. NBC_01491]|uniref:ATP-grasp domain-containing protein n=1 Tax=Spirillospora sp. NBC_01491 TaxID=2976007 RepID=UPI002E31D7D6|nr:ATP-grasp domain-containing protein [Spirillospora sp. NBC_01491]
MSDEPLRELPLLLVIGHGSHAFRGHLLESVSADYRVHLFCREEPSWELPHITGWTRFENIFDTAALAVRAVEIAAAEPVRGVLSWSDDLAVPAAYVAEILDLPGGKPEMVVKCSDKHLTRKELDAAGVPQPRSIAVSTTAEALRAAETVGYPVVLKPRGLAGSIGIVRVDDPAGLSARFPWTRRAAAPGAPRYDVPVLVEEYLDGPEISIDAVIHRGRVQPIYLARKVVGYEPFFAELGHVVNAADPLLADQRVIQTLQAAHAALGFSDGATFTEMRLTARGPKVIELNGRLGGDLLTLLGRYATGVDAGLVAAAVACGRRPILAPDRRRVAGIRFFHPERDDTTIASIGFDRDRLPPSVVRAVTLADPGETVSPPSRDIRFGRIAYAIAVTGTPGECEEALDAAEAALRVETN